jgi:hypothetical protein
LATVSAESWRAVSRLALAVFETHRAKGNADTPSKLVFRAETRAHSQVRIRALVSGLASATCKKPILRTRGSNSVSLRRKIKYGLCFVFFRDFSCFHLCKARLKIHLLRKLELIRIRKIEKLCVDASISPAPRLSANGVL